MGNSTHYLKLYYQRLITSTTGWTDEEFGAYLRLLIYQFDQGSIPNNKKELKKIITSCEKNYSFLSKKFDRKNNRWVNSVMDEVRRDAQAKILKNRENGNKGGRPKKPNGFETENQTVIKNKTQTEPIPVNHIPYTNIHNTGNTEERPAPIFENVEHAFISAGGSKEMAKNFFDKYEATGWRLNGSQIVRWESLISKFIVSWHEIKNRNGTHQEQPKKRFQF